MTITTHVALEAAFSFTRTETTDPTMTDFLDAVVDHLYKLDAEGVFAVADEGEQTFLLSLTVAALPSSTLESVVGVAMSMIRTAAHACGADTPDWPTPTQVLPALQISLIESTQRVLQLA